MPKVEKNITPPVEDVPEVGGHTKEKQPSVLASIIFALLSVGVVLVTGIYVWWQSSSVSDSGYSINQAVINQPSKPLKSAAVAKFTSEAEFKQWLSEAESDSGYGYRGMGIGGVSMKAMPMMAVDGMALEAAPGPAAGGGEAERFSETNVQVAGLDEPDIVKTDGSEIYFSPERRYYYAPTSRMMMMEDVEVAIAKESIMPSRGYDAPKIKNIRAFPPEDLKLDAEIDQLGEMLLFEDTLVVLASEGLYAYDVSDPTDPQEKWNLDQEDGVYLVTARLMEGKIYLVTRTGINYSRPCPMPLFESKETAVSIACGDVWHPVFPYPSDTTYAVSVIDAASGQAGKSTAFVGSSQNTDVYMSPDNLYVATGRDGDSLNFFYGFIKENSDMVPDWVSAKIAKIVGYDISSAAKTVELEQIMSSWVSSLSSDEQIKLENELENRLSDYYEKNLRNWESTALVRVDLTGMTVDANGTVPGRTLNQFSMDEKDGNLRIAVTIGGRQANTWQFGLSGGDHSVSDVYVLDESLDQLGVAEDMGKGERIYSVRFLGNRGYVVTFKETDPFYVLDLSNPNSPEIKGELKIPGYSSYLHPIGTDKVLGLGKEGSQVKISLFGVSDPTNPTELAKYTLKEYWSDVLNNHHAFLLDARHEVFFMPGGKGGYVFSYKGDDLSLARAIGNIQAKRAIYIDDYLYVIGEDELVVLDENDWKEVNDLDLTK